MKNKIILSLLTIFFMHCTFYGKNIMLNLPVKAINMPETTQINSKIRDRYNLKKSYFDYSVVLTEFPKNYYYTTVKINKSKERILIITDKVDDNKTAYYGLFYYFAKNGFVYHLGYLESIKPLLQSKNYLYMHNGITDKKFYISDKNFAIKSLKVSNIRENLSSIEFDTIESADKFAGDFGEPAGDDLVKVKIEGFYFLYHKPQYKKEYIKSVMNACIKDGVKTQVQMYCCVVNKIHD